MLDVLRNDLDRADDVVDPLCEASASLIAALTSGGDSRMTVDPLTCLSKYLCPPVPRANLICLASCTASPISLRGFGRAARVFDDVMGAAFLVERVQRLAAYQRQAESAVAAYFGAAGLADVLLCPSGTDGMLLAARLLAADHPHQPITAILPCASETGTGVPRAASCQNFDGPGEATPLPPGALVTTTEIPLRHSDGRPRSADEVNAAYRIAAREAPGRPVVYLTYGTKTGLIAPMEPPDDVDVIVDACQARIDPATVASYLRRGWPVVVTGSKFFGGPAFSGALLVPRHRQGLDRARPGPRRVRSPSAPASLGTVLRWMAALDAIEAFPSTAPAMAAFLRTQAEAVTKGLATVPGAALVEGLSPSGSNWADLPSIFTVAIWDPADQTRFLSAAALQPLYRGLARHEILLGQPVTVGQFGGLRIAFGARDVLGDGPGMGDPAKAIGSDLPRVFDVLRHVISETACGSN